LRPALPRTPPAGLIESPYWVEDSTPSATERVGSAVGEALGSLSSRVRSVMRLVAGRSKKTENTIEDLTDSAEERASELSRYAEIRFDEFRRTTYRRIRRARTAARHAINERPLESLLAIGGMGIVIGFVLRIWRSNVD
jgi:ElaB/YqjD/DUF883 family membrane-anchored ribosome-binding protein